MAKTVSLRKKTTQVLPARKGRILQQLLVSPDLIRASYVRQYLTCGKTNCRCQRGFMHGPFFYLVQCLPGGRIEKFLLKTREQREKARVGIEAHTRFQVELGELSQINTELLRREDL